MTIYKSSEGKAKILALYDAQLQRLQHEYSDLWVDTQFGRTHLIQTGKSDDIFETAKLSITYAKIKTGMPSNASARLIRRCNAPTLVMAAEKDCMFPAKRVIPRAQKIIPDCSVYLLKGRGHMHFLTEQERSMIVDFLKQ